MPELSAIKALIDNARLLRLELAKLAAHEQLQGPASEAVSALASVSAHLEKISEILAVAKVRKRRRVRNKLSAQPELPNTGEKGR